MDVAQKVNLQDSTTGNDLYQSHKQVVSYWSPFWDKMELYYDNLAGDMWTPDEKLLFKRKKKAPVVINDLKPAERTILGLFIQNKYDVKFAPREEAQDISDVLQKLYAWTAYSQDWAYKDIETVRQAWCGGVGYQEVYMKIIPGKEPVMVTNNINPFSIAWDPESRDLINREDAEFVDRDTWVSFNDLQELFPDKVVKEEDLQTQGAQAYQQTKTYADRSAEWYDTKNNRFKVTERYYKVRNRKWHAMDGQGNSLPIQDPEQRGKYEKEGYKLHSETEEKLFLAILCPAWNFTDYLYNGEYHCQPRDLFTGKIIFPFVELIAESINGMPSGFVQHLVPLNRLTNSAVSNLFHAQKHAASTALVRKKKLFGADEAQAQAFDKNHSDADRVFIADNNADLTTDMAAVPKGIVSQDTDKTLELGQTSFQRISSTPPSIQGQNETGPTSGVLNSQRIEQAFVQLQPFIANIKHFLKRRAELVYYYWREYYTYPMKVRIVGGQSQDQAAPGQQAAPQQTHVAINQEQPATDWQGNPTGAIEKINDINSAKYDVDIEDSYQSPTYRAKVQQQLTDVMQRPNIDPNLMDILFMEYSNATDMAQATKDLIKQHVQQKQQAAQNQQPQQKPVSISFAFKGEDMTNPAVLDIIKQSGVLPPQTVDELAHNTMGAPGGQPAEGEAAPGPMDIQKHLSDMALSKAKLEGQHLQNAQHMQKIADNEVAATMPGLPSAQKSLAAHPTAFSPAGAR